MHVPALVGQAAGEGDDLGDHQLDHAASVGERGVEHCHAPAGGTGQIDLVGTDTERSDRHQLLRLIQHRVADLGPGADPEHVDVGDAVGQLTFVECRLDRLDFEAGLGQAGRGSWVDVFQ